MPLINTPLLTVADLHAQLLRNQRLLGIDFGSRSVGLALSDVRRVLASPFGTLPRGKLGGMAGAISGFARQEDIGGLVVGLPLQMDGRLGPAAQAARDWTFAIAAATGLPAAMWDERLSSAEANRTLSMQSASRARRGATVDRLAAAVILQAALDSLHAGDPGAPAES